MTLAGRATLGSYVIIIAVVWLVITGAIGRFAAVAWGADTGSPPPTGSEGAVRLEPVVVSASRVEQRLRDVPANVTVITREEIKQDRKSVV